MIFSIVLLTSFIFLSFYIFYYNTKVEIPKSKKRSLTVLIIAGVIFRLLSAFFYKGHETDMMCFDIWSDMLKHDGLRAFYAAETFTDYPPGYMYVLYALSFIKNIFGDNTIFTYIILKLPAIISDILCGVCIYKLCEKNEQDNYKCILAGFFIFNPAVIFNSSVWGQVDSVFTLFTILLLTALTEKKMIQSYFLFALAIFIKPQALFYAPVLLFGIIENVFLNEYSAKKFWKNLLSGLSAILLIVILSAPFGINHVISQYISTLGSYNYASVNAYNLWSALGCNWAEITTGTSVVGYFFILLTVVVSAFLFFSNKNKNRYFLCAAFICFSVFVLSVKMHERYAFPVMALILCSYVLSSRKEEMYLYIGISALQFLNMVHILFFYSSETAFQKENKIVMITMGFVSIFILLLFCIYIFKICSKAYSKFFDNNSDTYNARSSIEKKDMISLSIITFIYSVIALYNLGNFNAPQTFETLKADSPMVIDLGDEKEISKLKIYLGAQNVDENNPIYLSVHDKNNDLTYYEEIVDASVFYWGTYIDSPVSGKYLEIQSTNNIQIGEIGIFDNEGNIINIQNAPEYIIDEQSLVPKIATLLNSTYFDEIYHARTAYEFNNRLPVYEWTHPPLGKIFISLGVGIFGMTPFGWRIMGTFFGILMIPIFFIFTKKMFKTSWISILSTVVFAFDFMHFTQTRIATIDVYVTFFIILMYLFMYKYINCDFSKDLSKTLIPLGLSGLCMGLGIASKWTGAYAGAGLALLYFSTLIAKCRNKEMSTKYAIKSMCFCLAAFVLLPLLIYVASYIPFMRSNGTGFSGIIQNQIDMLSYHGDTVVSSEHPFSSQWYKWIVNYRPIWYYSGASGNLSENVSAFINPAVCSVGLLSFIYCLYDAIRHRNSNAIFLVVAYLAQLLPWTFVERTTFIYHYFPCIPFLVLMIAHSVHRIYSEDKIIKPCFIFFVVITVLLFILFYPVISGFPVNGDFVREFLRWLPSWRLIG